MAHYIQACGAAILVGFVIFFIRTYFKDQNE
jgi:hypothetical protein